MVSYKTSFTHKLLLFSIIISQKIDLKVAAGDTLISFYKIDGLLFLFWR